MTWRDLAAGGIAAALSLYSVSDGNAGHAVVQVGLILAGAVLVYEVAIELLEELA